MIDPDRSIVYLIRPDVEAVGTPLCADHSARLRPPVGWTLRDDRIDDRVDDRIDDRVDDSIDDSSTGDYPAPDRRQLDRLLDARSPLLARAFRGVRYQDAPSDPSERRRSRSAR